MGVRVRLTRNSSAYFPFWFAIPVVLVWYTIVLAALIVAGIFWLVFIAPVKGVQKFSEWRRS